MKNYRYFSYLSIFFTITLSFSQCKENNSNSKQLDYTNKLKKIDWKQNSFEYAKLIIEIENLKLFNKSGYKQSSQKLIEVHNVTINDKPSIFAICRVEEAYEGLSSLSYYFINPITNKLLTEARSTVSANGCDFDIPAFVIKDLDMDNEDDLIFLRLYNKNCQGDFWIEAGFDGKITKHYKTHKDDSEIYLKLRNDTQINRKTDSINRNYLQKILEKSIEDNF